MNSKGIVRTQTWFLLCLLIMNTANAADLIEKIGDVSEKLLPATAIAATAYHRDLPGFYEFAYAGLTTGVIVESLKYGINRERPNGHPKSFPSGHTAAAFVGAGFLQMRYGVAWGLPAYALAAFTGYSRIESNNHWTSDVLAGAAIGLGTNWLFTTKYGVTVKVEPYVNTGRNERGVSVSATLA